MESRKKRNLEIERVKRKKRLVFTGILSCLIVLAVAALAYAIWDINDRRTIMTLNGERVPTTDFRFFHSMQQLPPGEEAQQMALDELTTTLLILERAEQHGVGATQQEINDLLEEAREMRRWHAEATPGGLNFISERRIAEIMAAWMTVMPRLIDIYMADFTPDEQEYLEFIELVTEFSRPNATEVMVKYISSDDWFVLDDVVHEFADGADFDDLIRRYSSTFTEDSLQAVDLIDFSQMYPGWGDDLVLVFDVPEGELSHIIEIDGKYFILLVEEVTVDEENLQSMIDMQSEHFINEARMEAFEQVTLSWIDQANRQVNQRAIRRF